VLLGEHARVRARGVDERDQRQAMPLGELHHPDRLLIALWVRHPELAVEPLLDVAALLVADDHDGAAVELADPGDESPVVGARAVAVELDPVVDHPRDVVERVRTVLMAGELDRPPDLLVRRLRFDPLELGLQPLELARDARAAQQRRAS
jgi:hypothetical protein